MQFHSDMWDLDSADIKTAVADVSEKKKVVRVLRLLALLLCVCFTALSIYYAYKKVKEAFFKFRDMWRQLRRPSQLAILNVQTFCFYFHKSVFFSVLIQTNMLPLKIFFILYLLASPSWGSHSKFSLKNLKVTNWKNAVVGLFGIEGGQLIIYLATALLNRSGDREKLCKQNFYIMSINCKFVVLKGFFPLTIKAGSKTKDFHSDDYTPENLFAFAAASWNSKDLTCIAILSKMLCSKAVQLRYMCIFPDDDDVKVELDKTLNTLATLLPLSTRRQNLMNIFECD